jgi:5-formyltetrahydrofolate cyclo-ligase
VRLGRGKGFYDRALVRARPHALRVGVGFSAQCFVFLPLVAHDQRMTHLVDELGVRPSIGGSWL